MSRTPAAKALGMPQTGCSEYAAGENDPRTAAFIKLARFYNTSVDCLLGETDFPLAINSQKGSPSAVLYTTEGLTADSELRGFTLRNPCRSGT